MKTEILDNYIEVTAEAINWVMLWAEHQITPHVLEWHGIAKGEDLEQRLSELSTKSIEAEIYENSTPTDLRDYALIFYKKLNDKGALFKFEFEDRSFNYEREYIKCIDNLLETTTTFTLAPCAEKPNDYKPLYLSCPYNFKFRKFRYKRPGLITKAEAKAIASCIDNIVTYVYQNSEELIEIFKGLGLKERTNNGADAKANIKEKSKSSNDKAISTQQRQGKKAGTVYEIDNESVLSFIYKALNEDAFSLSKTQFSSLVEYADFSSIYGMVEGNKAKVKWMISCLSICMGNAWYKDAAKSIEVTPTNCSGAVVAEYIKNKLNKAKIDEIIKRKQ